MMKTMNEPVFLAYVPEDMIVNEGDYLKISQNGVVLGVYTGKTPAKPKQLPKPETKATPIRPTQDRVLKALTEMLRTHPKVETATIVEHLGIPRGSETVGQRAQVSGWLTSLYNRGLIGREVLNGAPPGTPGAKYAYFLKEGSNGSASNSQH